VKQHKGLEKLIPLFHFKTNWITCMLEFLESSYV